MKLINAYELRDDRKYLLVFDELTTEEASKLSRGLGDFMKSKDQIIGVASLSDGDNTNDGLLKKLNARIQGRIEKAKEDHPVGFYTAGIIDGLIEARHILFEGENDI